MNKKMCENCFKYLSSYEIALNERYKLNKLYCKECMFGLRPIVEWKYDLEKVALDRKGYKSWDEWGDGRKGIRNYIKNLAKNYGTNKKG